MRRFSEGDRLGEKVRAPNQARFAYCSRESKVISFGSKSHVYVITLILRHLSGYNHSGKQGSVEFLNGVMGIVNAQRTLRIIESLIEFIMLDNVRDLRLFLSQVLQIWADSL